jgi:hypothetical protein
VPCESLVRTHCRRYVRTRAPKVVVPDARVASTRRPGLGAASRHTEPALDWSTPDREATQQCGCVVALGTRARTQNGHIRNDTRDVPRRISRACNSAICRKKYVASDRACTRVTLQNFHPKEGVGVLTGHTCGPARRRDLGQRRRQRPRRSASSHAPRPSRGEPAFASRARTPGGAPSAVLAAPS